MKKWIYGVLALTGLQAGVVRAASVTAVESWSGTDTSGWVSSDLINEVDIVNATLFSVSNNALKVAFPSHLAVRPGFPPPMSMPPEEYLIKAGPGASGGQFTGDYLGRGVAAVSFRIYCDAPVEVCLAFRNQATNRWWQMSLGGLQVGVWQTITVPIDPTVLKDLGGAVDWASFEQDIRNVSWMGLVMRRSSSDSRQTILVDDFSLSGPGTEFAAWMMQFRDSVGAGAVTEVNPLPDGDLDGDGVKNSAEWIAGTSAGDSNDCLRVTIEPGPGKGVRLKWNAKAGRTYGVWRCTDLTQGFNPVSTGLAPAAGDTSYEDSGVTGPVFYRIDVKVAQ
jgi:hypothetical protein